MPLDRLEFEVNHQFNYTTTSGLKSFTVESKHFVEDKQAAYVIYKGFIAKNGDSSREYGYFLIDYRGAEKSPKIDLYKNILTLMNGISNVTLLLNAEFSENTRIFIPGGSRIYCCTKLPANAKVKSIVPSGNGFTETHIPTVGEFTAVKKEPQATISTHSPAASTMSSTVASSSVSSASTPASSKSSILSAHKPMMMPPNINASTASAASSSHTPVLPNISTIPSQYIRALTPPDGSCMFYAVTLAVITRYWNYNVKNNQQFAQLDKACRQLFDGQNEFTLSREAVEKIPALLKKHNGTNDFNPLIKSRDATFQSLVENNLRKRLFQYMVINAEALAANNELRDQLKPLDIDSDWIKARAQEAAIANEWGELPQLFALSKMINTPIVVYRGPTVSVKIMPQNNIVFGKENKSEPIRLLYTGDHYDFYIAPNNIPNYKCPNKGPPLEEILKKAEAAKKANSEQAKKIAELTLGLFKSENKPKIKSKEEIEAENERERKRKEEQVLALAAKKRKFQEQLREHAAQPQLGAKKIKSAIISSASLSFLTRSFSAPHDSIDARRRGSTNLESWLKKQDSQGPASRAQVIKPRDYQLEAIRQFIVERSKNNAYRANALIVLPTGTGKTGVMSMLSGNSGEKHVILAPWVDVVTQTQQAVRQFASLGLRIAGVKDIEWTKEELAERRRLEKIFKDATQGMTKEDAQQTPEYHAKHNYGKEARIRKYKELINQNDIIVASNQFMYRKKVYKHFPWKQIDSVSFDEVHHVVAPESKEMILHLQNKEQKEIIGYTATPSEELYELFGFKKDGTDNPIKSLTMMEAIDKNALVPLQFVLLLIKKDQKDTVDLKRKQMTDVQVERKLNLNSYTNAILDYCLNTVSQRNQKPFRDMTTLISCAGVTHVKSIYQTIKEHVTIEQIDSNHDARALYAHKILAADLKTKTELIARAQLALDPNNLTLPQAQQIADSTFKVVASLYIATGKKDDEKNADMLLDKKIYEMGGIRFMVTCGKLGEGYSLSRIEHLVVARMPTSKTLVSQLGGRVTRLDSENPEKIGHITQVATDDAIDRVVLYAEQHLTKNGMVHFCYPPKDKDPAAGFHPQIKLNSIAIPNPKALSKDHWEEPDGSKKMRIKRRDRLLKIAEAKNNPQRNAGPKKEKSSFLATIEELKKLLDELKILFKKVEHMEIEESPEISAQQKSIASLQEEKSAEMADEIPQFKPSALPQNNLAGNGVITRSRHSFLLKTEETLLSMGNFLNPLYQAISSGSDWKNTSRGTCLKRTSEMKSEELLLAELSATAKDLLRKIFRLRRNQYVFSEEFVIDELSEEEKLVNEIDKPDKLEKCINLLKETLEQEKKPIIEAISRLKDEARNKSRQKFAIKLRIQKKAIEKSDKGCSRDYLNSTKDICADLDPNNNLSLFDILKKLYGSEGDKNNIRYLNYTGVIIEKLTRNPGLWNSIDPETGETVLHALIKIGLRLRSYKGEMNVYRTFLNESFKRIDPQLLGHRDNKNKIPIQLLSEKSLYSRQLVIQVITGYARHNFNFKQQEFKDEDFQIKGLSTDFSSYYFAVRNKNYNIKEGNDEETVLHHLYLMPRYLIDEILQQPNLDFTIQNKLKKTPIDILLQNFSDGVPGKQLATLLTIIKKYPAVRSANADIYHRILEQIILDDREGFPYVLIKDHFPSFDLQNNQTHESLETVLINSLKKLFMAEKLIVINASLFEALKCKNLSEKARKDLVALFNELIKANYMDAKEELASTQQIIQTAIAQHTNDLNHLWHLLKNFRQKESLNSEQVTKLCKQFFSIFELKEDESLGEIINASMKLETNYREEVEKLSQFMAKAQKSSKESIVAEAEVRNHKKRKTALQLPLPPFQGSANERMSAYGSMQDIPELSSPLPNSFGLGLGLDSYDDLINPEIYQHILANPVAFGGYADEMDDEPIAEEEQSDNEYSSDNPESPDEQDVEAEEPVEETECAQPASHKRKFEEEKEFASEMEEESENEDEPECKEMIKRDGDSESDYSSDEESDEKPEPSIGEDAADEDADMELKDSDVIEREVDTPAQMSTLTSYSRMFQPASVPRLDYSVATESKAMDL